jgi:hypothetical protein
MVSGMSRSVLRPVLSFGRNPYRLKRGNRTALNPFSLQRLSAMIFFDADIGHDRDTHQPIRSRRSILDKVIVEC